ncbi:MAG: hypothetical protein HYW01_05250 [Deltaproteobacteria bacterium]|nr:hypothetical protein [Deltaproteobacteria bacterium]
MTIVIACFIKPAFDMYLLYSRLDSEGLTAEAKILKKETQTDSSFLEIFSSHAVNNLIRVEFEDLRGNAHESVLGVSRLFYDKYDVGDVIQVLYLRDDPNRCKAAAYIENTKYISKFVIICGAIAWLLFVLLPGIVGTLLISRADNREEIKLEISEMKCPECCLPMQEGYVPLISGINWRCKGESVGLLTVFSVLPGTVWWNPFNRPKLHGFHCPRCKIILFKYRK